MADVATSTTNTATLRSSFSRALDEGDPFVALQRLQQYSEMIPRIENETRIDGSLALKQPLLDVLDPARLLRFVSQVRSKYDNINRRPMYYFMDFSQQTNNDSEEERGNAVEAMLQVFDVLQRDYGPLPMDLFLENDGALVFAVCQKPAAATFPHQQPFPAAATFYNRILRPSVMQAAPQELDAFQVQRPTHVLLSSGDGLLYFAATCNHFDFTKDLLRIGCNPDAAGRGGKDSMTALQCITLHTSISTEEYPMIALLVHSGACVRIFSDRVAAPLCTPEAQVLHLLLDSTLDTGDPTHPAPGAHLRCPTYDGGHGLHDIAVNAEGCTLLTTETGIETLHPMLTSSFTYSQFLDVVLDAHRAEVCATSLNEEAGTPLQTAHLEKSKHMFVSTLESCGEESPLLHDGVYRMLEAAAKAVCRDLTL